MTHLKGTKGSGHRGYKGDKTFRELLEKEAPKECGYGCGTRIFKNKELQIWQEEWSEIIHDRRRCWAIKEQQKREVIGDTKAPRIEIVEELRDVITKLTFGIPQWEQIYHAIKSRKDRDDAVTIEELAMALNPDKVYVDKRGTKKPTPEALAAARHALQYARNNKMNDNVAPFAVKYLNGQFRYYNMQNRDDFKPVEKRIDKDVEGRLRTKKRFIQMIELGVPARQVKEEKLDAILDDKARRRKKKRDNEL